MGSDCEKCGRKDVSTMKRNGSPLWLCVECERTPSPDPGEAPGCKDMKCGTVIGGAPWYCSSRCLCECTNPAPRDMRVKSLDPRDAAIARWPWMAPFREVKVGSKYAVTGCKDPWVVSSVDWSGGFLYFTDNLSLCMSAQNGWGHLTPYREAKPVEAPKKAREE